MQPNIASSMSPQPFHAMVVLWVVNWHGCNIGLQAVRALLVDSSLNLAALVRGLSRAIGHRQRSLSESPLWMGNKAASKIYFSQEISRKLAEGLVLLKIWRQECQCASQELNPCTVIVLFHINELLCCGHLGDLFTELANDKCCEQTKICIIP